MLKLFQRKVERWKTLKKTLLFIDESGFATHAPRDYGYSLKGERCYGKKNWQEKGRINVLGALIAQKLLTVCLFSGNINSDVFYCWVQKDLLPKLPPKSVLVMDNAPFHIKK